MAEILLLWESLSSSAVEAPPRLFLMIDGGTCWMTRETLLFAVHSKKLFQNYRQFFVNTTPTNSCSLGAAFLSTSSFNTDFDHFVQEGNIGKSKCPILQIHNRHWNALKGTERHWNAFIRTSKAVMGQSFIWPENKMAFDHKAFLNYYYRGKAIILLSWWLLVAAAAVS